MSKLLYSFLANEIINFFRKNPFYPGDKYTLLIEDKYRLNRLYSSLSQKEEAQAICVDNIYSFEGLSLADIDTSYSTYELMFDDSPVKMIIATSINSNQDYLATLRNNVGLKGSILENHAILYLIDDDNMDTIQSAIYDLQGEGKPLNYNYISQTLIKRIDEEIVNKYEQGYLKYYLEKQKEEIIDDNFNVFELEDILEIIEKKKIEKQDYLNLGFFYDDEIYKSTASFSQKDLKKRIALNNELYGFISHSCNSLFIRENLENELKKRISDDEAESIAKNRQLEDFDFSEINESYNQKKSLSKVHIENIFLKDNPDNLIVRDKGTKNKTNLSGIICNIPDNNNQDTLILTLSAPVERNQIELSARSGKKPEFKIRDRRIEIRNFDRNFILNIKGGPGNNHLLCFAIINVYPEDLVDIRNHFEVTKRGIVNITLPEDANQIRLGTADCPVCLDFDLKKADVNNSQSLLVSHETEEEAVEFSVFFYGSESSQAFKLLSLKADVTYIDPIRVYKDKWAAQSSFGEVPSLEKRFFKIQRDGKEYGINEEFRKYLILESNFVEYNSYSASLYNGDFNNVDLELSGDIKDCLDRIFEYYRKKKNVPSLTYIDEDLNRLYINYIEAVITEIESIKGGQSLPSEKRNLTKLGIINMGDRISFSPFHPLIVSYQLQFRNVYDYKAIDKNKIINKLSPLYLIPYLSLDDVKLQVTAKEGNEELKEWLHYEKIDQKSHLHLNNVTPEVVCDKIRQFKKHFPFLFVDNDSSLIINVIGFENDFDIIAGLFEFIRREYSEKIFKVQNVSVHFFVEDLNKETTYERFNRIEDGYLIEKELKECAHIYIDKEGQYNALDIVQCFFQRVSFYKHELGRMKAPYAHLSFYQMMGGTDVISPDAGLMKNETALFGLISAPSTTFNGGYYNIGFGSKGLKKETPIYKIASSLNCLYANEHQDGQNLYCSNTCVAKRYTFKDEQLLDELYQQSYWVVFINPEVDLNFFFKQKDLYVIHYTDQYTISSKYDVITVTRKTALYENVLNEVLSKYLTKTDPNQIKELVNYFNLLNGEWLLKMVGKAEFISREKLSIVSAFRTFQHLLKNQQTIWIPVSLEEVFRVSGSVGLPQEYIFAKKDINEKGPLSDDLLMIGLDFSNPDIEVCLYPIEVKVSQNEGNQAYNDGLAQIRKTIKVFQANLLSEDSFITKIYCTFFITLALNNLEKMRSYNLVSQHMYDLVDERRYDLLNLNYRITNKLPTNLPFGKGGLIVFCNTEHEESESINDQELPVYSLRLPYEKAYEFLLSDFEDMHVVDIPKNLEIDKRWLSEEEKAPITPMVDYSDTHSVKEEDINPIIISDQTVGTQEEDDQSEGKPIKILLGNNRDNQMPVYFEPNNTRVISHPNIGIIGVMGTGKTELARSIVAQLSRNQNSNVGGKPIGVLILDYKGDYKDEKFLNYTKGERILGNLPFNPLALIIPDEFPNNYNLPAITAGNISDSFQKSYQLGSVQRNQIKQAILSSYEDFGVTRDPKTWSKAMPTINYVIEKYKELYDCNDSVSALLSELDDNSIFSGDGDNSVSIFEWIDGVKVIDISNYPDNTKKIVVALLLDLYYAEMKQIGASKQKDGLRELRSFILIDEAHQFVKKDFKSFRLILSEGRMFGVGMILSTQRVEDFKTADCEYSSFILSWIIHHIPALTKQQAGLVYGQTNPLLNDYIEIIAHNQVFESLAKVGKDIVPIRDLPFYELSLLKN